MKPLLPIGVAFAVLAGLATASAQDTVVIQKQPEAVVIQPEQQTVIREYVQKNPAASINVLGLELSLGARVPETVELYEVPDVPYRYTVINDRTGIVDPQTHEIVDVLD